MYIYIYIERERDVIVYYGIYGREARAHEGQEEGSMRPTSLLTLPLLTLLDSTISGNSLWTWEFHPFKSRLCLSQTVENPHS